MIDFKKYFLLIIISLAFVLSCSVKKDGLEKDTIILKHFNKNEYQELKIVLNDFDSIISTIYKDKSFELSYKSFLKNLIDLKSPNEQLEKSLIDLSKFHISSKLKNDIWCENKVFNKNLQFVKFETDLNLKGKYLEFLSDFDETLVLGQYCNDIFASGGINSPVVISNSNHNFLKLDLSNDRNRLIIAIHYITINKYKNINKRQ